MAELKKKKLQIVKNLVYDQVHKPAKRVTKQPDLRTPPVRPEVSLKESRTKTPIPRLKPDPVSVAPGIEYA